MEKDSDQSLLRVGRGVGGQGMLPTFRLSQELSMSQGSRSICMVQARRGKAGTGHQCPRHRGV